MKSISKALLLGVALVNGSIENSLLHAVRFGQSDEVSKLISRGALINEMVDLHGNTALITAINWGNKDVVSILVESGADVDQSNNAGLTPLIAAAAKGNVDLVSILIESNANVGLVEVNGKSALFASVWRGSLPVALKLLENSADPSTVTLNRPGGETALMLAASRYQHKVATALIVYGADVNQITEKGTALMAAVGRSDADMVKTLIFAGAKIPAEGVDQIDALLMSLIRRIATVGPLSGILTHRQELTVAFMALKINEENNLFKRKPFRALFSAWNDVRFQMVSRIVGFLVTLECGDLAFYEIFSKLITLSDKTGLEKLGGVLSFLVSPLSKRASIFQTTGDKTELMQFNMKTFQMMVFASHITGLENTLDAMHAALTEKHEVQSLLEKGMRALPDVVIGSILQYRHGQFGTYSEFAKLLKAYTVADIKQRFTN